MKRKAMLQRGIAWGLAAAGALAAGTAARAAMTASGKEPIYLGVRACAACHRGPEMGHQFSLWRLSAHARAYAALAKPEAKRIALLSGVPEEPQKSRLCLGCHATAADTEEWERDDGFRIQDGLQCEACHGPGSEYATAKVMRDPKLAMANGLRMPEKDDCMMCHRTKGSHEATLKKKPFDLEKAWRMIAHPIPRKKKPGSEKAKSEPKSAKFQFVGVMACAKCHQGPMGKYCFSRWRAGPHAQAYAVLAAPKAREIAAQQGLAGDPQRIGKCLECHTTGYGYPESAFKKSFDRREGVQCEACHGPGSGYAYKAVMEDPLAAKEGGLRKPTEQTCLRCHEGAHGMAFDVKEAWRKLTAPLDAASAGVEPEPKYKTPLNMCFTPDGRELWVACEASRSVVIVDPRARRKLAEIEVGGQPTDVCFDPAGKRAFVSNRLDDTVSVVDVASRKVVATIQVGDEPHGVLVDRQGKYLYVLDTSIDRISVFDLKTLKEVKRLAASRNPWSLAISPDGKRIFVSNALSRFVKFRTPAMSEITVVDTERAVVTDRFVAPAANLLQGIAWHPSGRYAVFTLNRTKNLVPMTRLLQGWTITNGIGIVWADGRIDQVLLDWPNICFPDPADVTITPDGKYALVTSSGSDRVAVVDLNKLIEMLEKATPYERERVFPNHLGLPTEFVKTFLPTGKSPQGIACDPQGNFAFTANSRDDTLTVIDLRKMKSAGTVDLGGPKEISRIRYGEQLFHSAEITFHREFSCHTCHPDGHIDGMTYDIEPDGIGMSPVDNRTLRGIYDTAPFKWEGTNPTLSRQCGPRLAVFFTRIQPFTPTELSALDYYIAAIPRPPNRYRKLGAPLTPAQRRGKAMFERIYTNDGRLIPKEKRCTTCHPPPLYTDGRRHDVGTKGRLDREGRFDAPHLNNIYDSAPYLHDGRAPTLEEIWTIYNPYDQHGITNDMTKDQLNDLIEYLKTL
ncbi:MAG: beta-propeller fold lactonase family protein [Verrucomicrobia bacterium]|nr:beta-propeller fold lactonase family protein [Verrucomicrobiota bacterium]